MQLECDSGNWHNKGAVSGIHVACDEQQTERHLVESGLDQIEQLFKKPNAQENKACSLYTGSHLKKCHHYLK